MLTSLHIENIAVIERADVRFGPGLNVLTGETGAGKSIVIDALGAILGARTSRELVRTGAESALVSAEFTDGNTAAWCAGNEIEPEDGTLILQRRISADGKSSCRVCGVPVTAAQLRALGGCLMDIHGQNDGRQLLDETRHMDYLDAFGGLSALLGSYEKDYAAYCAVQEEISRLRMDEAEKAFLTERLSAAVKELGEAELQPDEEAALEARHALMKNAGKLTDALDESFSLLYDADASAAGQSAAAESLLQHASGWAPELGETAEQVRQARLLLEDAAERVRELRGTLDFSPEEYDRLETRLSQLRRLQKKYGRDVPALLDYLEECRTRLDELEYADDRLLRLEKELRSAAAQAKKSAAALTAARHEAADRLRGQITEELRALNMPSVRFDTEILPLGGEPGFGARGDCTVRFLMSANAGEKPGRIAHIASGGELSRIMLAMKTVFARSDSVPSMVFDEIDTGVSGIAAQRVGEKLSALSKDRQVLCVTHLPQIAAMADTHFAIEKTERGGRTFTELRGLDREGRIAELARLQSGDRITPAAKESAAALLEAAAACKENNN